ARRPAAAALVSLVVVSCSSSSPTPGRAHYEVGVETVVFVDGSRSTPAGGAERPGRHLDTTIWYPARPRPRRPVPVIVFAHGLGAAPAGYEALRRAVGRGGDVGAA